MFAELERAWRQLQADPDVTVIVKSLAGACDSSYGEGAPPSNDAAADSTDATSAVDGSSGSCVPEPIEPFDVGPEDAHCGPNGLEIDLTTSNDHCGFCGNACNLLAFPQKLHAPKVQIIRQRCALSTHGRP